TSTLVAAVQSWPALKYPAMAMFSAASARSASSNTITGALPPSSRCTRLRSVAPDAATSMPARVDPVIDTMAGVLCATSARPVSRSPHMTFRPSGAGEEAHLVDHRRDLFGRRQLDRLARVLRLRGHQVVGTRLEGVGELEQRLLPDARRRVAPGLERGRRRGISTIDVLGARNRRGAEYL